MIGGDADGSLRFWDAASGVKLWTLPVHKSAVIGVHLEGVDIVTRGFTGGQKTDPADTYPFSNPKQCGSGLIAALDGVERDRGSLASTSRDGVA